MNFNVLPPAWVSGSYWMFVYSLQMVILFIQNSPPPPEHIHTQCMPLVRGQYLNYKREDWTIPLKKKQNPADSVMDARSFFCMWIKQIA